MAPFEDGLPVESFPAREAWEAWLSERHATSSGIWLKLARKGSGKESVTHLQALEVALCYGWIDGQKAKLDDDYWLQRFTPRGPRSKWSQVNRERALSLIEEGRMRRAGLEQVERARADGRWEAAYSPQSRATVPDDLQRELDRNPAALEFFTTLDSRNRYAILYRIEDAKRPATRARRIERFVAMLSDGKRLHG